MDRFRVALSSRRSASEGAPVTLCPALAGLTGDSPVWFSFGRRRLLAPVAVDEALPPGAFALSPDLQAALGLPDGFEGGLFRAGEHAVGLGPLISLLISRTKLSRLLAGHQDRVYCTYARAAAEVGALLLFFTADGIDEAAETASGYRHRCDPAGGCRWEPVTVPLPAVVYDRCFGGAARPEVMRVREVLGPLGVPVLNTPVKITKLLTFACLGQHPELAPHLPYTVRLTRESLAEAMEHLDDIYIKPDHLYKGKGILRLTRRGRGWMLQQRAETGNWSKLLAPAAVAEAVHGLIAPDAVYLLQEGLDLATYRGNRFDFRSLVQKDGRGRWQVSGLVARLAPVDSVITSPRSGGQVAHPEEALSTFGSQRSSVLAAMEHASIAIATRMEEHLGPCAELGLDLGVTRDGQVALIEVNGRPLRVSLERLRDPAVSRRIDTLPIHYAAYLAMQEARV